ncbi:MAG: MotA/TolQ/ExbB proton channel family protein [Proteobacteria bacterium]|nr:MotA/TolQ/ExbB proton channel family protein [Pseudomonadota bacterium]
MLASIDSGIYTVVFCALIAVVFAVAWRHLKKERNRLAALNSYILMKYRLGMQASLDAVARDVVEDITRVEEAPDRVRQQTAFGQLWKRAVRLESSVDFWVDLLQKLGLLGTVLGLGFALAIETDKVADLLEPLSMAVWTTVVGLMASIVISWRFGRDMDVEVDAHEEHLKEWQAALSEWDFATGQAAPHPDATASQLLSEHREQAE